jgi:hypothetical protein
MVNEVKGCKVQERRTSNQKKDWEEEKEGV